MEEYHRDIQEGTLEFHTRQAQESPSFGSQFPREFGHQFLFCFEFVDGAVQILAGKGTLANAHPAQCQPTSQGSQPDRPPAQAPDDLGLIPPR